ncbi:MAG: pentapeptide repeat-containing protein, partial [Winogradskyella sp.]|nr:pentapeptide repeat-containing protein [Winogradskyella sp.]
CYLENVEFSKANLSQAIFKDCNLFKSTFNNTNLEKANFKTSYNFYINPQLNSLKLAKFSKEGALNLLKIYQLDID